jgi:hypothetical protein
VSNNPRDAVAVGTLTTFSPDPARWHQNPPVVASSTINSAAVGRALYEIGNFGAAQLWCERAVAKAQRGDMHARVDHASLGSSLHRIEDCLSSQGQFAAAPPWYERAVAKKQKADVYGMPRVAEKARSLVNPWLCELGPIVTNGKSPSDFLSDVGKVESHFGVRTKPLARRTLRVRRARPAG